MWLFTRHGFLSIVQKREDEHTTLLTVRARSMSDLEWLQAELQGRGYDATITEATGTDYPFRLRALRMDLSAIAAQEVLRIDYSNFKDTVPKEDAKRHRAYMSVWGALLALEPPRAAALPLFDAWEFDTGPSTYAKPWSGYGFSPLKRKKRKRR